MAALSSSFHGRATAGEGSYPGSGGNMNSVYAGPGMYEPMSSDAGYDFSRFPAGSLPVGQETQEFRISDSEAFNNLRGIARSSFPFDPYPTNDSPHPNITSLKDNFQSSDLAGISSLLPGKYNYNQVQGTLGKEILAGFDAGVSTYNSLPNGVAAPLCGDKEPHDYDTYPTDNESYAGLTDQHRRSFTSPAVEDVPLTPFHIQYPNFGNGHVDYGFNDPGSATLSNDIIEAYRAVLPEGKLAGTKQDLMPVFSGIAQEAVEQRPMMQSLGRMKNTLWLGGATHLPDELTISPIHALMAGSNAEADIVQTPGELVSALQYLGYTGSDYGVNTSSAFGAHLPQSTTLAKGPAPKMSVDFYSRSTADSKEPLDFSKGSVQSSIGAYGM